MVEYVPIYAIPLGSFADPTPPAGSAVDQTTTAGTEVVNLLVFGGLDGNGAIEEYLSQSIKNTRTPMTGFGVIAGYIGAVTEPLYIGIARTQINPNGADPAWEAVGMISPGDLTPGSYYYLYLDLSSSPITIPANTTFYMILATDQMYTTGQDVFWAWAGFTTNPYANGKIMVMSDGSTGTWLDWDNGIYDGAFWTWTQSGGVACSSYTTQPTCVAAGCYWYNGSCHTTAPICSTYTTQATCQAAGCYWCNGVCQTAPCGTVCSDYVTNSSCTAAGCEWCSDGTCKSDCGGGTKCEDIKLKAQCTAPCFWYQKYIWEEEKCHDKEQDMLMDYLPIMIGGVVAVAVVGVLVSVLGRRKQNYPPPYYPPPQYPPYPPQQGGRY